MIDEHSPQEFYPLDDLSSVPIVAPPVVWYALHIRLAKLLDDARENGIKEVTSEMEDLLGYLGIQLNKGIPLKQLADSFGEKYELKPSEAMSLAEKLTGSKLGRPIKVRQAAVFALEMRLHDPKTYSWWRIADLLCDRSECHLETHKGPSGDLCCQRIRQAVIALRRVLKKHGMNPQNPINACQDVEKSD